MVDTGLSPADPARWWISHAVERERAEAERDDHGGGGAGTGGQDIKVLDHDAHTQ